MISPLYLVAVFAILSIFASVWMGSIANYDRSKSEEYSSNWLAYYQEYLDNHENVDAKDMAEDYRSLSSSRAVESFRLDIQAGYYQLSAESALLSVVFFLVGFSVPKDEERIPTNLFGFAFLSISLAMILYTTLVF